MSAHMKYKSLLRKLKKSANASLNDELCLDLTSKDSNSFWRGWNSVNGSKCSTVTRIDGCVDKSDIANSFSNTFSSVYLNANSGANSALGQRFRNAYDSYHCSHIILV